MLQIFVLLISASASVVFLFVISKLLGKKQIAQLTFVDYVIGISIGNIAGEMATNVGDKPMWFYLVAMTIFFLFDVFVTFLGRKGSKMKKFLKGKPICVVYDGKIKFESLKKSKLDVNELMSLCRQEGFFDLKDVAFAIFENSGKLSVLPKSEIRQLSTKDFGLELPPAKLPNVLVVDGNISFSTLSELKKDKTWLFEELKITDKKQLKQIIFAEWDNENSQMIVHKKEN